MMEMLDDNEALCQCAVASNMYFEGFVLNTENCHVLGIELEVTVVVHRWKMWLIDT